MTIETVVREAIDGWLASLDARRSAAAAAIRGAAAMPVPDVDDLLDELDAQRRRPT